MILSKESEAMKIYLREVKHCVNKKYMHKNDSVMTCTEVIPPFVNTFEKYIHLSNNFFTEFESKLFQDK